MRALALASVLVVALVGCTPSTPLTEPEDTMTEYQDARSELTDLLDLLQAVVPGEWTETAFGAESCQLPGGGSGAQSGIQRLGPGVAAGTEREVADQFLVVLADAGFEAISAEDQIEGGLVIRGGYPASGTDENGLGVRFGVSPNGSTLDSMTRCVPGDANEINLERQD